MKVLFIINFLKLSSFHPLCHIIIKILSHINLKNLFFKQNVNHTTLVSTLISRQPDDNGSDMKGYHVNQCTRTDEDSIKCYWDLIAILSLLKFLQLPLFFQYLVDYLQQRNKSDSFIKFIRVSECKSEAWMSLKSFRLITLITKNHHSHC